MNKERTATVELMFPVEQDGLAVDKLVMRRPKVRDSRDAARGGGSDADVELRQFANLCEVSPELLEDLDMADYIKLQEAFRGFFPEEYLAAR